MKRKKKRTFQNRYSVEKKFFLFIIQLHLVKYKNHMEQVQLSRDIVL